MKAKKNYQNMCYLLVLMLIAACGGSGGDENIGSTNQPVSGLVTQGVAVDPYIVGAIFQEVAEDGVTILQRQSTPTDENGVFTFPMPLTVGSTVEMKISNKGTHGGAPFGGMLRRSVNSDDSGSVVVTPVTTLLSNGMSLTQVQQLLAYNGFSEMTVTDLYVDPMQGIQNKTSGVTDQDLRPLQANMAVEAFMEITGNFQVTVDDLLTHEQSAILSSMSGAIRSMMNANEFNRVTSALANDPELNGPPNLEDFIMAVLGQERTLIALVKDDMVANNGLFNQNLVDQTIQNGMGQMVNQVKMNCQARQPQPTIASGDVLYADNCAGCHGGLSTTTKANRSATQIQSAIDGNVGSMGYLNTLTTAEVLAIADAMVSNTQPSPVPADGPTLYGDNCAGCHGILAATNKPGRTAADIQSAIDGNVGGMGYLNTLAASEVQAIADAMPAAPAPDPTTPPDGVALYNSECAGCHGQLAKTNKPGRTTGQIQAAIDGNVGGMGGLKTMTVAEVQAIADALPAAPQPAPTTPPDGASLYSSSCASCHGQLVNTNKPGRSATQIQSAINGNVGGMGYLSSLTTAEVQAIADVLPAAPQPAPTTPPDGASLYSSSCASCHGQLANTNKPGRSATQIQSAINGNVGGMGYLSSLTTAEVQAIADVLPAAPPTGPGPDYSNCMSCHSQPTSGRHSKHISKGYSCTVCHNTTKVQTAHAVNPATTDPASTIGGGSTKVGSYSSGTCSSLNCHGSKSW